MTPLSVVLLICYDRSPSWAVASLMDGPISSSHSTILVCKVVALRQHSSTVCASITTHCLVVLCFLVLYINTIYLATHVS